MQNFLEYATEVSNNLKVIPSKNFAQYFVESKMKCFRLYQNGIITGNSHGVSFFDNVIQYWENPESYYKETKENKNSKKDESNYEYNFVRILLANKTK